VYLASGLLLQNGAAITAGTIVAFTTVQARLTWPLMGLLRVALDLQTSSALFARIFEYLDLKPAITDAPDAVPVPTGPAPGGVDVKQLQQESLLGAIGIVSQETYLFHATIRDNLKYARPEATDDEIRAAAEGANLHDTIAKFPDGYDTVVGERGYRLSGGEKQ